MLGAALLAQGVLAGPLVLDGGAELLLEVARQRVAAWPRVSPDGDLHLPRRVDVDEDRGTWPWVVSSPPARITGPPPALLPSPPPARGPTLRRHPPPRS